jgi:ElaB/YqjD/DUF883 family membrane-anchored ribosome-binding protein
MELYFKDLISEEASLEKLVDDLMLVVQGVDELVQATGANLERSQTHEIASRLQRLKEGCRRIEKNAIASALAVDKVLRQYPYSAAGFAFALGLTAGRLLKKQRDKAKD